MENATSPAESSKSQTTQRPSLASLPYLPSNADDYPPNEWREFVRHSFDKVANQLINGYSGITRIPPRYQLANAVDLTGPTANYSMAVESLLSLHPKIPFSSRPRMRGGIIALIGPRGTGKTHMACGLINAFNCNPHMAYAEGFMPSNVHSHRWAVYRRAFDVFSEIKQTFGRKEGQTQRDVTEQLVKSNLLVLDEIQVRAESAWENDLLTNLIDQRYAEFRPTVLISNLNRGPFIECVGDSIASRLMETGGTIEATWPSFRLAPAA
jgi:DNA replication protein DnaC